MKQMQGGEGELGWVTKGYWESLHEFVRKTRCIVPTALMLIVTAVEGASETNFELLSAPEKWELIGADFLESTMLDDLTHRHTVTISLGLTLASNEQLPTIGISFDGACNGHGLRRTFDPSSGNLGTPVSIGTRTTQYCDDWRADFDRTWSGRILSAHRIEIDADQIKLHTSDGVLSFVRRAR